jgi:hypothetical protein
MCFAINYTEKGQYIVFIKTVYDDVGCSRALVWHYRENKYTIWEFGTEFTCGEVVKKPDGTHVIVLGDYNGYVWEFPYGDMDGMTINGTHEGTVDVYQDGLGSPYGCALLDADAQFPTSGLGLSGVPIYIYDGTGKGQWTVIAYNTADTLFFDECFGTPLDHTSKYYIGTIIAQYRTGWLDFGTIDRIKDFKYYHVVHEKDDSILDVRMYKEFVTTPVDLKDERTNEDFGQVDLSLVGRQRKPMGGIRAHHLAWELYDIRPNNPWTVYDFSFDFRSGDE